MFIKENEIEYEVNIIPSIGNNWYFTRRDAWKTRWAKFSGFFLDHEEVTLEMLQEQFPKLHVSHCFKAEFTDNHEHNLMLFNYIMNDDDFGLTVGSNLVSKVMKGEQIRVVGDQTYMDIPWESLNIIFHTKKCTHVI